MEAYRNEEKTGSKYASDLAEHPLYQVLRFRIFFLVSKDRITLCPSCQKEHIPDLDEKVKEAQQWTS